MHFGRQSPSPSLSIFQPPHVDGDTELHIDSEEYVLQEDSQVADEVVYMQFPRLHEAMLGMALQMFVGVSQEF